MKYFDSMEVERLKKLIQNKSIYYQRQVDANNKPAAQAIQKEIVFLRDDILPLCLQNSNIAQWEMIKYVLKAHETAQQYKCNALLLYLPISENYTDSPIVGIANTKQALPFRTIGAMQVYCNEIEIINTDGSGAKVQPICLTLNDLMP